MNFCRDKSNKTIVLLITEYSLLLYFLFKEDWKESYYLWLNTRIEANIINNMRACGADHMYGNRIDSIKIKSPRQICLRIISKLLRLTFVAYLRIFKSLFFKKSKTVVYGQDHASLAKYFYNYHFTVIEDGMANYNTKIQTIKLCLKYNKKMLDNIIPYGFSDNVEEVYLAGRKTISDEVIQKKAKVFDIRERWNLKSRAEQAEILFIFGYDKEKINKLFFSGRNIILVTQNFSGTYCTDDEQIEIYRRIMQEEDGSRIIIKTHPGDNIVYERVFPQCVVLRDKFPLELIYLTNVPIKKIITVNSTSVYGLWPDEMIERHEEYFDWLLTGKKEYGDK